ncbi:MULTISPECIES: hypothetical protein [unclassified Sporolactobacillus]|uniref:hypothetical protein n=1 Tax=unclassified Sporolactobacillus TaxID=2628533 RepID=UPI0023689B91|nr:hypothetical protein [Sporolactobacillus sp. CQH2019]MDD9150438.1 hypothetical protein [Sporolactobacillus sp. CQH2019]
MKVLNWLSGKLSEPDYEELLKTVYATEKGRQRERGRRLLVPLLLFLLAVLFALIVRSVLPAVIALGVAFLIWKFHYVNIRQLAQLSIIKRRVNFALYFRVLVPIAEQTSFTDALEQALKQNPEIPIADDVHRLIGRMIEQPDDIKVFWEFGERAGAGSDQARTLCTALFEFQQNTKDPDVLRNLAKMASDELFRNRKKIREMRIARFNYLAFAIFLGMLIPFSGSLISYLSNFGKIMTFHG